MSHSNRYASMPVARPCPLYGKQKPSGASGQFYSDFDEWSTKYRRWVTLQHYDGRQAVLLLEEALMYDHDAVFVVCAMLRRFDNGDGIPASWDNDLKVYAVEPILSACLEMIRQYVKPDDQVLYWGQRFHDVVKTTGTTPEEKALRIKDIIASFNAARERRTRTEGMAFPPWVTPAPTSPASLSRPEDSAAAPQKLSAQQSTEKLRLVREQILCTPISSALPRAVDEEVKEAQANEGDEGEGSEEDEAAWIYPAARTPLPISTTSPLLRSSRQTSWSGVMRSCCPTCKVRDP